MKSRILPEYGLVNESPCLQAPSQLLLPPSLKKTPPKAVPVSEEEAKIAPVANTLLAKPVPHGIKNYKVQRGDTLYGIARRHSLSVETIRTLNPDVEDRILVGQQIAVQQPVDRKAPATTSTNRGALWGWWVHVSCDRYEPFNGHISTGYGPGG